MPNAQDLNEWHDDECDCVHIKANSLVNTKKQ